jgi:hypothetical protein
MNAVASNGPIGGVSRATCSAHRNSVGTEVIIFQAEGRGQGGLKQWRDPDQ